MTFEEYVEQRWDMQYRHVARLIDAASAAENLTKCSDFVPTRESHVRELLALEDDAQRERHAEANRRRAEKAREQHKVSNPRAGEKKDSGGGPIGPTTKNPPTPAPAKPSPKQHKAREADRVSAQAEPKLSARGRENEGRPEGFATETAKATGKSKASINRDVKRANDVCQEARDLIPQVPLPVPEDDSTSTAFQPAGTSTRWKMCPLTQVQIYYTSTELTQTRKTSLRIDFLRLRR